MHVRQRRSARQPKETRPGLFFLSSFFLDKAIEITQAALKMNTAAAVTPLYSMHIVQYSTCMHLAEQVWRRVLFRMLCAGVPASTRLTARRPCVLYPLLLLKAPRGQCSPPTMYHAARKRRRREYTSSGGELESSTNAPCARSCYIPVLLATFIGSYT
jgi:hypothetical protein